GNADAHHELPDLAVAALFALGGAVAVITLINTVEFEQRIALLVEGLRRVGKVLSQPAPQMAASLLDRLGLGNGFDGLDLIHATLPRGINPAFLRDSDRTTSLVMQIEYLYISNEHNLRR